MGANPVSRIAAKVRDRLVQTQLQPQTRSAAPAGPSGSVAPSGTPARAQPFAPGEVSSVLPERDYFMAVFTVGDTFGGMTAMCLKRAELYSRHGRRSTVLTFDAYPDYPARAERLRAKGLLAPGIELRNIYQALSESELPTGAQPADTSADEVLGAGASELQEHRSDGTLFRRVFTAAGDSEKELLKLYLRPDGSVFVVDRVVDNGGRRVVQLVARDGSLSQSFSGPGPFYRWWLDRIVEGRPSAVMVDSAFASRFIAPWKQGEHLKVALVHVNHVKEGSSPMTGTVGAVRKATFDSAADWDAVVFLTERQKSDFERRFGTRSNIYRVPNPRERVEALPAFEDRDPLRGVSVTRLEKVKNVDQTIAIMKIVRERVPGAYVDVYGTGSQEAELRRLAEREGMADAVRFHGHVTDAAEQFRTAAFCVFPSHYEGLPLAMMESLGRGCPVVSYDIDYGPSDLLEDGFNGYLVPVGDARAAADRIVGLISEPELAAGMSRKAWERAASFGEDAVVERWARVLNEALLRRAATVKVSKSSLDTAAVRTGRDSEVHVEGRLVLKAETGKAAAAAPGIDLVLRSRKTGEAVARSTADARPEKGGAYTVSGEVFPPDSALDDDILDVSVEWSWENAAGSQRVAAPQGNAWFPYATVNGNVSLKHH